LAYMAPPSPPRAPRRRSSGPSKPRRETAFRVGEAGLRAAAIMRGGTSASGSEANVTGEVTNLPVVVTRSRGGTPRKTAGNGPKAGHYEALSLDAGSQSQLLPATISLLDLTPNSQLELGLPTRSFMDTMVHDSSDDESPAQSVPPSNLEGIVAQLRRRAWTLRSDMDDESHPKPRASISDALMDVERELEDVRKTVESSSIGRLQGGHDDFGIDGPNGCTDVPAAAMRRELDMLRESTEVPLVGALRTENEQLRQRLQESQQQSTNLQKKCAEYEICMREAVESLQDRNDMVAGLTAAKMQGSSASAGALDKLLRTNVAWESSSQFGSNSGGSGRSIARQSYPQTRPLVSGASSMTTLGLTFRQEPMLIDRRSGESRHRSSFMDYAEVLHPTPLFTPSYRGSLFPADSRAMTPHPFSSEGIALAPGGMPTVPVWATGSRSVAAPALSPRQTNGRQLLVQQHQQASATAAGLQPSFSPLPPYRFRDSASPPASARINLESGLPSARVTGISSPPLAALAAPQGIVSLSALASALQRSGSR